MFGRHLNILVLGLLVALAVACGNAINLGGPLEGNPPEAILEQVPSDAQSGSSVNFIVSWTRGEAPYYVDWDFGGGAEPNIVGKTAQTSPCAKAVNLSNAAGGSYTVTVHVTDSLGQTGEASASYSYTPAQPVN